MNPIIARPSRLNLAVTNKLSLAHHGSEDSTILPPFREMTDAPGHLLSTTQPQPNTTTLPTSTTTFRTSTNLLDKTNLSPVYYNDVSLPPPTAAEMALIKVLEEAVKIEQLQEKNRSRTCRHLPAFRSRRLPRPRCSCHLPPYRHSISAHPKAPEWTRQFPGIAKFWEGMVSRKWRDSLDEEDLTDNQEVAAIPDTTETKKLPRSGRNKGFGGFGGRRGTWGNWNWGNFGGRNNANNGGFWNRGLPGLGMSLFENRAGSSTPPSSDSLPDLSMGGLSARLLNLRWSPSAVDLTRTNPTSASRTPSMATSDATYRGTLHSLL